MKIELGDVEIECIRGNIVHQHGLDVIVNAANAQLVPGGGVAGAIHRAAGPGLAAECRPLAPIRPGQAVATSAHNLPNRWIIHCLGPVYGRDEPAAELLADCYRNALRLAEDREAESIAFPAISAGAFGYPAAEAARVSVRAVAETVPLLESLELIRFVMFDAATEAEFAAALASLDAGT